MTITPIMNTSRVRDLGWKPQVGLNEIFQWTIELLVIEKMRTRKISFFTKALRRRTPTQLFYEIIKLLLGYPLYLISFLCSRNKKKWAFGHKNGFVDNAKYLYLYAVKQKGIQAYWITQDKKLVQWMRDRNLPVYYQYSLNGIYHCLTSYLYIYTTSSDAINFFTSGNSILVNLWHGVGVKNFINTNAGIGDEKIFCKIFAPYVLKKPNYLLVPTYSQREYFKTLFSINEKQLIDDIYPRCAFLRQEKVELENHIRMYEPPETATTLKNWRSFDLIYLYMPTWRAHLDSTYLTQAFPDMEQLNETLRKVNALLVIKQHPTIKNNKIDKEYSHVHFINNKCDIYPLLPFTDILITDYSSIYSDYLLMDGKGVILYPFDLKEYEKTDLSLMDYEKNMPGTRAYNFYELLELIERKEISIIPEREEILSMYWGDYKHKSVATLFAKLINLSSW